MGKFLCYHHERLFIYFLLANIWSLIIPNLKMTKLCNFVPIVICGSTTLLTSSTRLSYWNLVYVANTQTVRHQATLALDYLSSYLLLISLPNIFQGTSLSSTLITCPSQINVLDFTAKTTSDSLYRTSFPVGQAAFRI